MHEQRNHNHRRRGESVMVSLRIPKELYDRLPVEKAYNAGKEGGISAFLRRHMIESVERELAANGEQAA